MTAKIRRKPLWRISFEVRFLDRAPIVVQAEGRGEDPTEALDNVDTPEIDAIEDLDKAKVTYMSVVAERA
jgi:hypothetical protein